MDQVAGYLPMVGMSDWVEQFRYNEISGQALLDLVSTPDVCYAALPSDQMCACATGRR